MKYPHFKKVSLTAYLLVVFVVFNVSAIAQNMSEGKLLRKARKDLYNERYDKAREKYLKLITINPNDVIYNFETGLSYYFDNKNRLKSLEYFKNAVKNTQQDTIPELFYYTGMAYYLDGNTEKSDYYLDIFDDFVLKNTADGKLLSEHVEFIKQNNQNLTTVDSVPNFKLINLTGINSTFPDYAPVLTKNKNYLVFTSRRADKNNKKKARDLLPYENVYLAKKSNGNWVLVTDEKEFEKFLPKNVNTAKHDAGVVYTSDGSSLFLYRKDQLWKSILKNNVWGEPFKLDKKVDYKHYHVPSAFLTKNGDTLYFSSSQKGGLGEKDIYYTVKTGENTWSDPVNLGETINTELDDDAPYLNKTGNILYFSSKGHNSIGGFDIFKSVKQKDGSWSKPQNLGKPFNSPFHDIYYTINETQDTGYFATDREGTLGGMDIWQFYFDCPNLKNIEIKGIAYNKTTKMPIAATLVMVNNETNDSAVFYAKPQTGEFLIVTQPQNSYTLKIYAPGYATITEQFDIPKQCDPFTNFIEIAVETTTQNNTPLQKSTIYHSLFDATTLANQQKPDTTGLIKSLGLKINPKESSDLLNILALHHNGSIDTAQYNYFVTTQTNQLPAPIVDLPKFENIYFNFDHSHITKKYRAILDQVVEYYNTSKHKEDLRIKVQGYTDAKRDAKVVKAILKKKGIAYTPENHEKYSKEYNLKLSEKRAQAAAKYLISKGIPEAVIQVEAYGEDNPVAPNVNNDGSDNPDGRKLNRRVEIKVTLPTPI